MLATPKLICQSAQFWAQYQLDGRRAISDQPRYPYRLGYRVGTAEVWRAIPSGYPYSPRGHVLYRQDANNGRILVIQLILPNAKIIDIGATIVLLFSGWQLLSSSQEFTCLEQLVSTTMTTLT